MFQWYRLVVRGRKRAARQNSCWNYRFFIIINGVRGPEARRHVTMRRTEAGANVEDGSNNQNMVFQFDLYLLACAADGYLFPGHLVHLRVPTASSVMQLVCYERQCPNIPCGALCTNNNTAPTAAMARLCSRCSCTFWVANRNH